MDISAESRTKKRYSYYTNPEINIEIDKKALKLAGDLPLPGIGHELALCGFTLLMVCKGEAVIIDPDSYELTFKKEKK